MSVAVHDAPDFTRNGLKRLLGDLLDAGYEFSSFDDDIESCEQKILLRHDIDVDLESALAVAEIEHSIGVRATYFFLLTSDLYNLQSTIGRSALQRILELGHTLGLHFDGSLTDPARQDTIERLRNECQSLELLAGHRVRTFSLHKPGEATPLEAPGIGLENAYSSRFFRDIGYVADSMGWWRFGSPVEQNFFLERTAGQIVIHPVWWSTDSAMHPAARLDSLLDRRRQMAESSLAETIRPFEAWLAGRTTDKWFWTEDLRSS